MENFNISLVIFSFGEKYFNAGIRLKNQSKKITLIKKVILINEENIPDYFDTFLKIHKNFILNNKRGFGYWLWKPYIIDWCLKHLVEENNLLLYLDAACELSHFGEDKLLEYCNIATTKGGLFSPLNTKNTNGQKKI